MSGAAIAPSTGWLGAGVRAGLGGAGADAAGGLAAGGLCPWDGGDLPRAKASGAMTKASAHASRAAGARRRQAAGADLSLLPSRTDRRILSGLSALRRATRRAAAAPARRWRRPSDTRWRTCRR